MLLFLFISLFFPSILSQGNPSTYERYYQKMEPSIQIFVDEIKEKPLLRKFLQQAVPMLFDVSKPPIYRKIGIEALAEGLDANTTTVYEDLESKIREIIQTSTTTRSRLNFMTKRPVRYSFWPELEGDLLCFIVKDEFVNTTTEMRKKMMFGFLEEEELFRELDILSIGIGHELREQPVWFGEYARKALSIDFSLPTKERRLKIFELAKEFFTEDRLEKMVADAFWMEKIIPFLIKFFPENQQAAYSLANKLVSFTDREFLEKTREEQQKWIKDTIIRHKNM